MRLCSLLERIFRSTAELLSLFCATSGQSTNPRPHSSAIVLYGPQYVLRTSIELDVESKFLALKYSAPHPPGDATDSVFIPESLNCCNFGPIASLWAVSLNSGTPGRGE